MNIEDYTPENFSPDKMHALKFLWLFNQKQKYFIERLSRTSPGDVDSWKSNDPVKGSFEQLQQETGMMTEDLWNAINIGSFIQEYIEFSQMTSDELDEKISVIESDHEINEEDREIFEELWDNINNKIEQSIRRDNTFKEIIDGNFNNQEEWPDS